MKKSIFKPLSLFALMFLIASCVPGTSSASEAPSTPSITSSTTDTEDPVESSSIYAVKEAEEGTIVRTSGVVVHHNYTGQGTPYITGFWLADDGHSIYVYGEEVAKSVEVGDYIKIKGEKSYYIPNTDTESAEDVNYKGMAQIKSPVVIQNDGGNHPIPHSAITETTISDILDIPLTTDITGNIYKVKGTYEVFDHTSYVNYGLHDINRVDYIEAYTQSNGKDYAWTEDQDGKTIEVILIVSLGKPGVGAWRFCPVEFLDEYTPTDKEEREYALERLIQEFSGQYTSDVTIDVEKVDPKFAEVTRVVSSYSEGVTIVEEVDKYVVSISGAPERQVEIECSITYKDVDLSDTKRIGMYLSDDVETITIADAISKGKGTVVTVEAIVARVTYKGSLVKQGMFLADDTGSIFTYNGTATQSKIAGVENGNKVIVKGTIDYYIKNADDAATNSYTGDFQIKDVEVLVLDENVYNIPLEAIKDSTIEDINNIPPSTNITGNLYRISGTVTKESTAFYTLYKFTDIIDSSLSLALYSQNSFKEFEDVFEGYEDKNVVMIVGIQNLNLKSSGSHWRACPIAIESLVIE